MPKTAASTNKESRSFSPRDSRAGAIQRLREDFAEAFDRGRAAATGRGAAGAGSHDGIGLRTGVTRPTRRPAGPSNAGGGLSRATRSVEIVFIFWLYYPAAGRIVSGKCRAPRGNLTDDKMFW